MFLMALRRFVARRGRCTTIYCDNGTNFVGAANCLRLLDWNKVIKHGAINNIHWKFNPPTAAWWGGWWERLIRVMKDLLKRVLGRALLSQEEMFTVLCDCESLMNSRPLTYISENNKDPVPLSPSMFLQDIQEWRTPDLDSVEQKSLNRRNQACSHNRALSQKPKPIRIPHEQVPIKQPHSHLSHPWRYIFDFPPRFGAFPVWQPFRGHAPLARQVPCLRRFQGELTAPRGSSELFCREWLLRIIIPVRIGPSTCAFPASFSQVVRL
ncbi:hypothetical protein JTE90_000639 [Oedothorax gibbosus]|uniref:Integrase catalytic domain-containing protein n=1 Tax=Oedothorax gibbosus TaxID=931172 RepID=A0AAV6VXL3_9ARAC|nr:hypothetical protein JTE90_000639 [Oedothorax gibbosus]